MGAQLDYSGVFLNVRIGVSGEFFKLNECYQCIRLHASHEHWTTLVASNHIIVRTVSIPNGLPAFGTRPGALARSGGTAPRPLLTRH